MIDLCGSIKLVESADDLIHDGRVTNIDRNLCRTGMCAIVAGFFAGAVAAHRETVDRIIATVDDTLSRPGPFDFGDRAFVPVIRDEASALLGDRATWHVPDVETLFVQRKVSGTALLGARLKARVDIVELASAAIADVCPPPP